MWYSQTRNITSRHFFPIKSFAKKSIVKICCLMEVYLTPGFSEAYFLLLHHSRSHEFWQLFFEISFVVITLRMWRVVNGWKMPVISTFHISTSTVSFLRGAQTIEGSGEINCNFTTYLVSFLKKKNHFNKNSCNDVIDNPSGHKTQYNETLFSMSCCTSIIWNNLKNKHKDSEW